MASIHAPQLAAPDVKTPKAFLELAALSLAMAAGPLAGSRCPAIGADADEFAVKREQVFEFAQKPSVSRQGDRVTVRFAAAGRCDATVAVEDAQGRIVRHLASGVLGPNAPAPFQKDAKEQTIVWDGKDDQGRYVDDKDALTIRVSLGLRPSLERVLFWEPKKRVSRNNRPLIAAAPEGVYVFEGEGADHLRLFDHDGNYLRTLYPFPADKLEQANGLQWATFPQDGRRLPLKRGLVQATLLTSGNNTHDNTLSKYGCAASALAVSGSRIALVMRSLNRLAADGTTGGLPLDGPKTSLPATLRGYGNEGEVQVSPRSAAFSPDGRWLYLAGYHWANNYPSPPGWLPGVVRVAFEGRIAGDPPAAPEPFAGSMKEGEDGSDDSHLKVPTSVACDAKGRVYVSDFMNDRIQVFSPDGKLVKSLRVPKPAQVAVHQTTGGIYVFSYYQINRFIPNEMSIKAELIRLGPLEEPREAVRYPLPLHGYRDQNGLRWTGLQYNAVLDSYADPPTIWLVPGTPGSTEKLQQMRGVAEDDARAAHILLLVERGKELVVRRDFGEDAAKSVVRPRPPIIARQRLYVNPRTGKLYVAEGDAGVMKSVKELLEIDPASGAIRTVELPFDAEDLAFDLNGCLYLRTESLVARYDFETMREVPWDYGEEHKAVGFSPSGDGRRRDVVSGLILPSTKPGCFHQGGMAVSPRGDLLVACYNQAAKYNLRDLSSEIVRRMEAAGGKPYAPRLYPGRQRWGELHVWDSHGRLLHEDAFPGLTMTDGVAMDARGSLYVLSAGNRVMDGKPYLLERAETLIKAAPGKAKIVSASERAPMPLAKDALPKRPPDLHRAPDGDCWVEGADWMYGGVGFGGFNSAKGGGGCACWNARFALDAFARSFAPEIDHFSVAVLDANGNLILRVGRYGNADSAGSASRVPLGGDEVGLFHAAYVATHTDRRLFIADAGNARILSVKLGYHAEERVALRNVRDEGS